MGIGKLKPIASLCAALMSSASVQWLSLIISFITAAPIMSLAVGTSRKNHTHTKKNLRRFLAPGVRFNCSSNNQC